MAPGFVPEFYPSANGGRIPEAMANESVVREFLAAYYDINVRAAELQRVREARGIRAGDTSERAALAALDAALRRRDELEDRHAPRGVVAEPVLRNGFTVDVQFTFGHINAAGKPRSHKIVSSAFISIPLPAGVRLESLNLPDPRRPGSHSR